MSNERQGNTVLVVDGGGRGAALVEAYAQSPHVSKVLAVPGNDLMRRGGDVPVQTIPELKTTDTKQIALLCEEEHVVLVDVAQDNAVAAGLVDELIRRRILTVGPTKAAGKIEWDKSWSREFSQTYSLPQPLFTICHTQQEGLEYLNVQPHDRRWFVKAAGLEGGKGALPARDTNEAKQRVLEMAAFKEGNGIFLIEEWLMGDDGSPGEEFSAFALSDGNEHIVVGFAQDNKRLFNGGRGPNTGGMGGHSNPLVLTPEHKQTVRTIFDRTFAGLQKEQRPYTGILYLGGMVIKKEGQKDVWVIEFNARWGDPEAQVLVPGIDDLFELSMAAAEGRLHTFPLHVDHKVRVVLTGAAVGYPGDYSLAKGKQIYGLPEAAAVEGVRIYGAGVALVEGKHYVNGGRLFYVVGQGNNVIEARQKAYEAMKLIHIEENNLHYRTDIGNRDVKRLLHPRKE